MIFTIFKKELKDTLRDRRTLMMMIFIPVLIFPVILNVFVGVSASFQEDAMNKTVKIGYVASEDNLALQELKGLPETFGKKELIAFQDTASMIAAIRMDSLQIGFYSPAQYNANINDKKSGQIRFFYDATNMGMNDRAEAYAKVIEENTRIRRLQELKVEMNQINPVETSYSNVASNKEMIGKLAGGMLPYIFIAFAFLGCMYPAIDLFTGEKERGTMETLLTTPVARWKILFGKMGVIVLSGLLASTCALLGLYISIEVMQVVKEPEILKVIDEILSAKFILMLYGLLIPLVVFFAGIMIPIAIYAKTFKEAQSIITPLNIVFIMIAVIGMIPGISLNLMTASIPVVNVVLGMKAILAGNIDWLLLIISFVIMIVIAGISVALSYRKFDVERNILN